MPQKRKPISQSRETEILFINDRTCCICHDRSKGVQIHHIDGNPKNNRIENLAVLCSEDHDRTHKKGGTTKGISPSLVKKYKRDWERTIKVRRLAGQKPLKSKLGIEKALFLFEIRQTLFRLNAISSSDVKGIKELLEYLLTVYLFEGYTRDILNSINDIGIMLAFSEINKSALLAEYIHKFFYHLVGPKRVPIRKKDEKNLKIAIDILHTIGEWSGEFNKSIKVIRSVRISLNWIWDIAIWYNREPLALKILKIVDDISKACLAHEKGEKPLALGKKEMDNLKSEYLKSVQEERKSWRKVVKRLDVKK